MFHTTRIAIPIAAILAGCHSYAPAPVDLNAHLAAFTHRQPDPTTGSAGLQRHDGRMVARAFHPAARLARCRAGIATAVRDHAGRWVDPQLQGTLQNILQNVPYRWVTQAQINFTLPINGRLHKLRELAERKRDEALLAAWSTEQRVANDLDRAWVRWSAARLRVRRFDATCEVLQRLRELAEALVASGGLTRPGARVFALEHEQRAANRELLQNEAEALRLDVLRHLGLHPDAPIDLVPSLDIAPFVAERSARRAALRDSPRLRTLELAHRTAEADLALQIRQQFPDLQLAPGWQEEDGMPRASLGFNLPLPLFTGNDPAIAKAESERRLAAEALRCGLEQLLQELAIAELRREAALTLAGRCEALSAAAEQQIADANALAEAGQFDPLLLLDAVLRVHDLHLQRIDADERAALATIRINDLLTDPLADPTPERSTATTEPEGDPQ